ncbi:hypothetical protein M569_02751, partial [Genlisea aurea]
TLDLSNNKFSGLLPDSFGFLKHVEYLRLNNNSLTGALPLSMASLSQLTFLDLSFNNLSGPFPTLHAKTFNVLGNPLICGSSRSVEHCYGSNLSNNPQPFYLNPSSGNLKALGNLTNFTFKELQNATDNFSIKNLLGVGGFGNVYRGKLAGGTLIAVKRLKDLTGTTGESQFRTELEMISLAVHRNLLRILGYCATPTERLLVYPYMSNGSVASRLRGKPTLDWNMRKRIAIGAARGLVYLHEQCDPKIIHRDVKAANVLLDDYHEAVVGDFGLAKLLDHEESHVTTAVCGTVGHIAPEYLSTGQSSEKTDVFGFGILLMELITGTRAIEFGKSVKQKGALLELIKKIQQEEKTEQLVDRELGSSYDPVEVGEMLQVALLCTQHLPSHRPKMSEVARMLEGDGLARKWAASHNYVQESGGESRSSFQGDRYDSGHLAMDDDYDAHCMELSGPR